MAKRSSGLKGPVRAREGTAGTGIPPAVRVLVTGGGTGGHVYPALAIIRGILARMPAARILYVGTRDGLEADVVPRLGIPFAAITARGLVGKSVRLLGGGVLAAARGTWESLVIVRRFRPHVVVGTGGYVSGPVVLAAVLARVPTALQEQNVYPGITNRILGPLVDVVFLPFAEAGRYFPRRTRTQVTGNPVRPEVLAARREESAARLGIDARRRVLLVFSGSRGAQRINDATCAVLPDLMSMAGLQVLYITGNVYFSLALERMEGLGIEEEKNGNLIVRPYLYNMEDALAVADVVVARAGAMTLAEITARGIPAILIPSPHVTFDHQQFNARLLAERGAAVMIPDAELTGERLLAEVRALLADGERCARMAEASRTLGRPDALDSIVTTLLTLAGRRAARR